MACLLRACVLACVLACALTWSLPTRADSPRLARLRPESPFDVAFAAEGSPVSEGHEGGVVGPAGQGGPGPLAVTAVEETAAYALVYRAEPSFVPAYARGGRLNLSPWARWRWSMGGELGLTTWAAGRRDRLWLAAPQLHVRYLASARWALRAEWGLVTLLDAPTGAPGQMTVAASNGYLGVEHALASALKLRFGVTVPLSSPGFDSLSGQRAAGYSLAAGVRGLWDAYLWAPERGGVRLGLELAPRLLSSHLWFAAEGDLAATVAVQRYTNRAGDLYAQTAVELLLGDTMIRFGARAQLVAITADGDGVQTAVAPVVRVSGGTFRVHARWVLNIDQPLGLQGAGLDISGLTIGVEGQL